MISVGFWFSRFALQIDDEDGVRQMTNRLNVDIDELRKNVAKLNAPNLKANQRMAEVKEREAETTEELENARKKAKRIRQQFEKVCIFLIEWSFCIFSSFVY